MIYGTGTRVLSSSNQLSTTSTCACAPPRLPTLRNRPAATTASFVIPTPSTSKSYDAASRSSLAQNRNSRVNFTTKARFSSTGAPRSAVSRWSL